MGFTITLPLPPSLNNAFFNGKKGRVKTEKYRAWQKHAVLAIFAQVRADKRVGGTVSVVIELPTTCKADIDNLIKPILDALVDSQRIDDDRNVVVLSVWKARVESDVFVGVDHWPMRSDGPMAHP